MQTLLQWKSNKYYIFWVCVFIALGFQCEMHMRHTIVCGLSNSTIFSTLLHKQHDFLKKKVFVHKMVF